MAFPQTPLEVLIELFISGAWTDITSDVYTRDGISISRGRADYGQSVDPSTCSLTLNNRSGKYSPRNPLSPYYGLIGRNTPLRVSVKAGTPFLGLPGAVGDHASTPDVPALDITGDLDVRVDCQLTNWLDAADSLATTEILGKATTPSDKSWFLGVRSNRLYLEWSADGTNGLGASSTVQPIIPPSGRLAIRATLDVNNGSGGRTITFYTAPSGTSGPWTQLGDPVVQTGTTSIFNSASALKVGDATNLAQTRATGRCYALEVRNGINGTVVANPVFTSQTIGASSFADGAGRTWTQNGATSITNKRTRFVGEVSSWPARWDVSGKDVYVPIEASGILRRLGQGAKPLDSTLRRRIPSFAPLAYWPMEEGENASQASSPITGVAPLKLTYANWAQVDSLPSSKALPVLASSGSNLPMMKGKILAPSGSITSWSVRWIYRLDSVPSSLRTFMRILSTGTVTEWYIQQADGTYRIIGKNDDGGTVFSQDVLTNNSTLFNTWIYARFTVTQNGGNVDWNYTRFDIGGEAGAFTGSFAGSIGRPTAVASPPDGYSPLLDGMALGHISAWPSNTTAAYSGAIDAWAGETSGARMDRLAEEENLPFILPGDASATEQVGVQRPETLVTLLENAADVDGGVLYEQRESTGLIYRDRVSLYNQAPALELDYTQPGHVAPPLEPVDDDQLVRNDITVQRDGGSSGRAILEEGPLSTQAPPNGVGVYDESVTLSLYNDDQPDQHAGWRLHLGTWDEARYPVLSLDLAAAPSLIDAVTDVDSGARVTIANPPSWLPPGPIDLLVQGYTETIGHPNGWDMQLNCSPAGPWDVAWASDDDTASVEREFAWVDTDGSVLAEDLTTTETDVDIVTQADSALWTSDPADGPYDLRVGGEVMTVTAPGGLLNTNPFFDTSSTGWSTQNCSIARSTDYVNPHPRALASLKVTPTGGIANVSTFSPNTATDSVTPGGQYVTSMWVYSPTGWNGFEPAIDWYTNAGSYISTSTGSVTSVAAGQWTYLEVTYSAPSTAGRAAMKAIQRNTPSSSDVWYLWAARITRAKASWLYDTFTRTSTSGWGIADSGNTWSSVGGGAATDYTLSGTYAAQILGSVDVSRRTGIAAPSADFDIYCDITTSATATGDSLYGAITARMLDANNMMMARVEFTTGNAIILSVRKMIAGVQTQLGTYTLPGVTHVAGTFVRVRFQGAGTAFKAKIWLTTDPEPDVWRIAATDSEITAANQIGTRSIRVTGNTNTATVEVRYDSYEVINPQTFTVIRSQNGIVKAHSTGADVRLADPAIVAL